MHGVDEDGYAAVVWREDGRWEAGVLPPRLLGDLDGLVAAVRQHPGEGGALGLVDVADDFFIVIRVRGLAEPELLLSDVTASADYALARQVVTRLGLPVPDDDDLDVIVPAGDLAILSDMGLDPMELGAVLADTEAYADEQLDAIGRRVGFGPVLDRALEAVHS